MTKKTAGTNVRKLPAKEILQLKIELQHTQPLVWRRLVIADNLSLWELHENLQIAMGWMNSHLMMFQQGYRIIGRPDWDETGEDDSEDARRVKIRELLKKPGDKMIYEYDFGDSWTHEIFLENVLDADESGYRYPRCIAGENAAPPEDCGGAPGFENLKRVIADPDDDEHEQMLGWLDFYYPNYDPAEFSLSAINKYLNLGASKFHRVMPKLYARV